jgi:hypothetical protein
MQVQPHVDHTWVRVGKQESDIDAALLAAIQSDPDYMDNKARILVFTRNTASADRVGGRGPQALVFGRPVMPCCLVGLSQQSEVEALVAAQWAVRTAQCAAAVLLRCVCCMYGHAADRTGTIRLQQPLLSLLLPPPQHRCVRCCKPTA